MMDDFLKTKDLNAVRTNGETDKHWEIRKRFLQKNRTSFPKNRLLSLSQIFMNVNFLGCSYNEELMRQVNDMGDGIIEEVVQNRKKNFEEGYVKASEAKKPRLAKNAVSADVESSETSKKKVFMHLKAQSGITEKGLEPLQRLNQTTARVKVQWQLIDVDGVYSLVIDNVLVLRNHFLASKTLEAKQYAAAAALYAINTGQIGIRVTNGRHELWRGDVGPNECYLDYVKNVLFKVADMLSASGTAQNRLESAFKTSAVSLQYAAKQGRGWEQEISFVMMNVVLASRVLRKGDCTKRKEVEHKEALAESIISTLSSKEFSFEETVTGYLLKGKD